MRTYYFGTDLTTAGHYFFELTGDRMISDRNVRYGEHPFNPEQLPVMVNRRSVAPKGMTRFYNIGHYSICAIGGSPKDERPGCKSVFYWEEPLTELEMIDCMKSLPIAMKIIQKMPFAVEVFKTEYVST